MFFPIVSHSVCCTVRVTGKFRLGSLMWESVTGVLSLAVLMMREVQHRPSSPWRDFCK